MKKEIVHYRLSDMIESSLIRGITVLNAEVEITDDHGFASQSLPVRNEGVPPLKLIRKIGSRGISTLSPFTIAETKIPSSIFDSTRWHFIGHVNFFVLKARLNKNIDSDLFISWIALPTLNKDISREVA